jgi:hypothetical protein
VLHEARSKGKKPALGGRSFLSAHARAYRAWTSAHRSSSSDAPGQYENIARSMIDPPQDFNVYATQSFGNKD